MGSTYRTKVHTFIEHMMCEEPGCNGDMVIQTGQVMTTHPERFMHECESCGTMKSFEVGYPRLITEEIGDEPA